MNQTKSKCLMISILVITDKEGHQLNRREWVEINVKICATIVRKIDEHEKQVDQGD